MTHSNVPAALTAVCASPQVEEELWEEEFIERCFQEMLDEEEQWEWFIPSRDLPSQSVSQLQEQISLLVLDGDTDLDVVVSLSRSHRLHEGQCEPEREMNHSFTQTGS